MPDSAIPVNDSALNASAVDDTLASGRPALVQSLRLGLFGLGLGGVAIGFMTSAISHIGGDPTIVLLFCAGALTAVSSVLLVQDSLAAAPSRTRQPR